MEVVTDTTVMSLVSEKYGHDGQRLSLVVHVHIVGGEAMRALTLMHVSTPVPRQQSDGQQPAGSWKGY